MSFHRSYNGWESYGYRCDFRKGVGDIHRILLLYDFVSDILKHKENRVKLQFAFCTVSFI